MIFEAKGQGATVEEALAAAKAALNAPETADVQVEILAAPQKKILGLFGGKKAEARAFYEVADAPAKPEKPKAAQRQPQQPKAADKQPQKPQPEKPRQKPQQKQEKPQPQKQEKPKKQEKPAPQKQAQTEEEMLKAAQEDEAQSRTPISMDDKPGVKAAAAYVQAVLGAMGVEKTEISAYVQADNEVLLELDCGDDYGVVIGRRGETLDAIQYLTRLSANRCKSEGEYSRISLNVGSYREKRRVTLMNLAKKNAEKVRKYGRSYTFEPMNPYERRIIHTAVQSIEGVRSHSVGSNEDRRVVLSLEDGVKPLNPSRGERSGGRSGGRNGGRGGRGGSRPQQSQTPTRPPKTDAGAEGISLYGKLN